MAFSRRWLLLIAAIGIATLAGAAWGFVPGFLKARTGAHEVITTIMLNYIAVQIVLLGLRSDFLRKEGSSQPISKVLSEFVRIPADSSTCRRSASTGASWSRW